MEEYNINISENQKKKIQNAIQKQIPVSIKLKHSDLTGNHKILLTQTQINKINKANNNNNGIVLNLSKSQLVKNKQYKGGFIGALAGIASAVLPTLLKSLGIGAATALGSAAANKIIGKGLYLKKGGCVCSIKKIGNGLYLRKINGKGFESCGDGLHLKHQNKIYDGKGLLLGPNSPFKNIPILGILL